MFGRQRKQAEPLMEVSQERFMQYRQGDVLIERVTRQEFSGLVEKRTLREQYPPQRHDTLAPMPADTPVDAMNIANTEAVLAYGEATGHAHCLKSTDGLRYFMDTGSNGVAYVDVPAGGKVEHEEHHTITLDPGVYRVTRQREFSVADQARFVAD